MASYGKRKPWVPGGAEEQFILDNHRTMATPDIARGLARPLASVEGRIRHLYALGKLEHRDPAESWRAKRLASTAPKRGPFLATIRKAWIDSGRVVEDIANELGWSRHHVYDLTGAYAQTVNPNRMLAFGRVLGLTDTFLVTGWILTFTRGMLKLITPETWDEVSAAIRGYIVQEQRADGE